MLTQWHHSSSWNLEWGYIFDHRYSFFHALLYYYLDLTLINCCTIKISSVPLHMRNLTRKTYVVLPLTFFQFVYLILTWSLKKVKKILEFTDFKLKIYIVYQNIMSFINLVILNISSWKLEPKSYRKWKKYLFLNGLERKVTQTNWNRGSTIY